MRYSFVLFIIILFFGPTSYLVAQETPPLIPDLLKSFQEIPLQKHEAEAVKKMCVAADDYFMAGEKLLQKPKQSSPPQRALIDMVISMDLVLAHFELATNHFVASIKAKDEKELAELAKQYRFRLQRKEASVWHVIEK